jgi:hypothetical protein
MRLLTQNPPTVKKRNDVWYAAASISLVLGDCGTFIFFCRFNKLSKPDGPVTLKIGVIPKSRFQTVSQES